MNHALRLLLAALLLVSVVTSSSLAEPNEFRITKDVIYGRKAGMALTYDVIQHREKDNDAAVLFMVSGGWFSSWREPAQYVRRQSRSGIYRSLVEDGYTLYFVRHGSAPYFKVPDAVADVRKAVRHIRHHAGDFTIDPNRIGVFGGSAGGHLSLMLGTSSDSGNPNGKTEVAKEASRVAAVVSYFAPVDLRRIVGPSERFPALDFATSEADSVSPLLHVTPDDPPTLLIHGDEDKLVPVYHSNRIYEAFQEANIASRLVVLEGAGHGFRGDHRERAASESKAWFDRHLLGPSKDKQSTNSRRSASYPPQMEGAIAETYKKIGDVELNVFRFLPPGHRASDKRPAIVFFFGGGWKGGTPGQFEQQCRYLASRGMVAMTADYRVRSRHDSKAIACVEDGKSAIRWVRRHATRLGVDPDRIVAGGGSAGGHVAACCGSVRGYEVGDTKISSRPNAMALFNPALVLAPVEGRIPFDEKRVAELDERMGVNSERLSPYHQVQPGLPPTIIFHGEADSTVAYATAVAFAEKVKSHGDTIKLVGYPDQEHGFFNYGRKGNAMFKATVRALDAFLVELAYLHGEATVDP